MKTTIIRRRLATGNRAILIAGKSQIIALIILFLQTLAGCNGVLTSEQSEDLFSFSRFGDVELLPEADTYVRSGRYANQNYGAESTVQVDRDAAGTEKQGFLRFSLGEIGEIDRATLFLYVANRSRDAADLSLVSSKDWSENSLTWNTRPSPLNKVIATIKKAMPSKWVHVDITAAVEAGQLVSIGFKGRSTDSFSFVSKEGNRSKAPRLVLKLRNNMDAGAADSGSVLDSYLSLDTEVVDSGNKQDVNVADMSPLLDVVVFDSSHDAAVVTPDAGTVPKSGVYVVAKDDPNADDLNPGTPALPWKTLFKAGNTAKAGDTVLVRAGTYLETLDPVNSGTKGVLITFKAYPGDECKGGHSKTDCKVVIDGKNTRLHAAKIPSDKFIRIEGFEMINHTNSAIYANSAEGIEIVNNFIHDNGVPTGKVTAGIFAKGSIRNFLIENNEIRDVYRGVQLMSGNATPRANGLIFRGNHIWHTYCDAFRGEGNNFLFEGNKINSAYQADQPRPLPSQNLCHRDGLDFEQTLNVIIRNNIFYDYDQNIFLAAEDNDVIENVEIYGNIIYGTHKQKAIYVAAGSNTLYVKNVSIHSNTFGWIDGYPIGIAYLVPIYGIKIRNNIFYDKGIKGPDISEISSDYNLFFQRDQPFVNEGPHSITKIDPQFVNYSKFSAWNFKLKPTSPAINAGDPALSKIFTLPTSFKDMDGNLRPQGIGYDIGAYEQ